MSGESVVSPFTVGHMPMEDRRSRSRQRYRNDERPSHPEGPIHVMGVQEPFAGKVIWARCGDWHLNLRDRMRLQFKQVAADLARLLDRDPQELTRGTSCHDLERKAVR
ncbi:MAG TPA: hypothetical protein VMK12_09220 [Anaeromyxobacteraceae bacterium]|nr:hypothetical protein [Anaeromyxobacteraceae bacterium]